MNILLIHPQMSQNKVQKKTMPMGLAYIAALCRKEHAGVHIEIFDAHILNAPMNMVFDKIRDRQWDVIGCSAWTVQMPAARYILEGAREIWPEALIMLGGTHPTMFEGSGEFDFCDYVFVGESERSFCDLLSGSPKKRDIPEIVKAANFIEDLDALPLPAWDLLPMDKYTFPLHVAGIPRIPIIGSRGCPYNCSFCSSPKIWKRTVRYRSPANIVHEILEAKRKYGYGGVHFWDDNFLEDPEHASGLCREMVGNDAGIKWVALTRASLINKHHQLLSDLKKAGCIALEVGLEAFDDNIYKNVHKGERQNDILKAVAYLKKNDIVPLFTFMTFMPGETLSTAHSLSKFFSEIMPETRGIQKGGVGDWPICVGQFTTPHIGTGFAEEARTTGLSLGRSYGDYHHHNINWLPHSFLNDVPVRTGAVLTSEMCTKLENKKRMLYAEFGDDFPDADKADNELSTLAEIIVKQADGIRSVRDIIENIIAHRAMATNRAYRLGAFVSLCLSQLEVLKSAKHRG